MSTQDFPWLDDNFVSTILKNDLNKSSTVKKYHCEPASKTGENFSSILHRLKVYYCLDNDDVHSKSYIVKCMQSPDTDTGKMLKRLGIFERESAMYSETLKIIQEILKPINPNIQLAPKYIYSITEPIELLVIEDLQTSGFSTGDRLIGFDLEHCNMVMRNLGILHAASMYLNYRNPQFRRHYNVGAFNPNMPDSISTYFKNGILQATEVMKKRPKCQKHTKIFEEFSKRIIEDGIKLMKPVPDDHFGFNVLNHGDLWLNNIMFKYDENGKPVDVRFVDFQMSFFGSCGLDINCFYLNSPSEEIRNKFRDVMLGTYHSSFVDVLKKLQYDGVIPSSEDLNGELMKSKDYSLMTICINLPIYKLNVEVSEKTTTDDVMNEDVNSASRTSMYDNILYQEALDVALEDLESIGFL